MQKMEWMEQMGWVLLTIEWECAGRICLFLLFEHEVGFALFLILIINAIDFRLNFGNGLIGSFVSIDAAPQSVFKPVPPWSTHKQRLKRSIDNAMCVLDTTGQKLVLEVMVA
ncbi:hypothetical protein PRIPAC_85935 [Pristionchus pacificus]|uniref:Uncharacterized protein n=1 Tax=Pristionchus pacificus TaxID=54126 RepID=A0A2A6BLA6_PRIPA|nr:hypothetical protein PRIPAC_85935 [Pristionchus pacificus]|eukprot:PDM66677.1 hypothetical protein PRIPAC_48094 [Pristionchus pacificus]